MEKNRKYYIFRLNMNILNILVIIVAIVLFIITDRKLNISFINLINNYDLFTIILSYLIWLILHEFIHGIGYFINGGKWNKIIFGASIEKGVLYCLCKQNISKKNILISSILPFTIIGVVTYIIGVIFKQELLTYLSLFNIAGSAGDIITFLYIIKLKNNIEFSEMDDMLSFSIYANYDVSKINHFGLKYIESKDEIERKDLNKIKISKWSILILVILFIISILFMVI